MGGPPALGSGTRGLPGGLGTVHEQLEQAPTVGEAVLDTGWKRPHPDRGLCRHDEGGLGATTPRGHLDDGVVHERSSQGLRQGFRCRTEQPDRERSAVASRPAAHLLPRSGPSTRCKPEAGGLQAPEQFTATHGLRAKVERPVPDLGRHVVVVALEGHAPQPQAGGEGMQLFVAGIAHEMGPTTAPPGPDRLVDKDRHAPCWANPAPKCHTCVMEAVTANDTITLRIPADPAFTDLPRVCLAVLLRVHRINPGDLGDLATRLKETSANLIAGGGELTIDYRATEATVEVVLSGPGGTMTLEAPRS